MATHIDSVTASPIAKVTKAEFYAAASSKTLLFCEGRYQISRVIEGFTHSPWSHVAQIWRPEDSDAVLVIQATYQRGVNICQLSDYVERYDGNLVLATRPVLMAADWKDARDAGLAVLDYGYNVGEEFQMMGQKLFHWIKPEASSHQYFCSALMSHMSMATGHPLERPATGDPTPEQNWLDPTVAPVCALVRG